MQVSDKLYEIYWNLTALSFEYSAVKTCGGSAIAVASKVVGVSGPGVYEAFCFKLFVISKCGQACITSSL